MKNRFIRQNKQTAGRNRILSACLSAAVFGAFWFGISSVSDKTNEAELQTLEQAVMRGITYCYAAEGSYPASLNDLNEHYGLFYDEEKYRIDYQPLGANIMPDVTIIRRKN